MDIDTLIERQEVLVENQKQLLSAMVSKNLHYLIPTLDIKSSKRGLRGLPNKMQIVYNLRILLIKK